MALEAGPAEALSGAKDTAARVASASVGEHEPFWLALSEEQVQDLLQQEARSRGGGRGLLRIVLALNGIGERLDLEEIERDGRYQRGRISLSVVHSLVVLAVFALGEAYGVNSLADEIGMTRTTTWRYLKTWVAVGVLEERKDRRYQLARRWIDQPLELVESPEA